MVQRIHSASTQCIGETKGGLRCRRNAEAHDLMCDTCVEAQDYDLMLAKAIDRYVRISSDEWIRLARSYSLKAKRALMEREHVPDVVLWQFLQDTDEALRKDVAQHVNTPPDVIQALVGDPSDEVRKWLCWRSDLPDSLNEQLLRDTSPVVLHYAVVGPGCRLVDDDWERLMALKDTEVSTAIAASDKAPLPILRELAESGSRRILGELSQRNDIASLRGIVAKRLLAIIADSQQDYAEYAMESLKEIVQYNDTYAEVMEQISLSPHTSIDLRRAIAANPNTPLTALRRIFASSSKTEHEKHWIGLIWGIAEHQNADDELLCRVIDDAGHIPHITALAARNAKASDATIEHLHRTGRADLPPEVMRLLARRGDRTILRQLSNRMDCPYEVQVHLAGSSDYRIRHNLALNLHTAKDILVLLALEDNSDIGTAAMQTLAKIERRQHA